MSDSLSNGKEYRMKSLRQVTFGSPDTCASLINIPAKYLCAKLQDFVDWVYKNNLEAKDLIFIINSKNPSTVERLNSSNILTKYKVACELSGHRDKMMTLQQWYDMITTAFANGKLDPDIRIYFTKAHVDKKEVSYCALRSMPDKSYYWDTGIIELNVNCNIGVMTLPYIELKDCNIGVYGTPHINLDEKEKDNE